MLPGADEEPVSKVQEAIIKEEENSRFFISGYFAVRVKSPAINAGNRCCRCLHQ